MKTRAKVASLAVVASLANCFGAYARNIEKNEEEEGIHLMNTLGEVALKRINGACILAPYLFAHI